MGKLTEPGRERLQRLRPSDDELMALFQCLCFVRSARTKNTPDSQRGGA